MKKGQAAMEFLMTYGWAILVVLIAIGALAYFGVLSPDRFLPESCTVGSGISCDDFAVKADGSATVILRNGMGADVTLTTDPITLGGVDSADCVATTAWANGQQIRCTWAAAALPVGTAGSRYKEDLVITYTPTDGAEHTKTGTLQTKYES